MKRDFGKGQLDFLKEYGFIAHAAFLIFSGWPLCAYLESKLVPYLVLSIFFILVIAVFDVPAVIYMTRTFEYDHIVTCAHSDENFKYVIRLKGDFFTGKMSAFAVSADKIDKLIESKTQAFFEDYNKHTEHVKTICKDLCMYLEETVPDLLLEEMEMFQLDIKEDKFSKDCFFYGY